MSAVLPPASEFIFIWKIACLFPFDSFEKGSCEGVAEQRFGYLSKYLHLGVERGRGLGKSIEYIGSFESVYLV